MEQTGPEFVFFNGKIVPYADARVHVMSPALKFGATVYEGLAAYWNDVDDQLYVFRLVEHCKRLLASIKAMRMNCPYRVEDLTEAVLATIRANEFREDLHIRQSVFIEGSGNLAATGPVGMSVVPVPRGHTRRSEGIDVCVSSWIRISDNVMPPRVKCCANYHNGRLAQLQATLDGYDAPLLLDSHGKVSEAPTASFFLVRGDTPATCPTTSSILESITRATLIQLFQEIHGIEVAEREIDRTELYMADEAFLCGSSFEVVPVVSVDRHAVGNGQIGHLTLTITQTYFDIARGAALHHSEWRTPVYQAGS